MQPGERLEDGIQDIHVLGENEALILRAKEAFEDASEAQVIIFYLATHVYKLNSFFFKKKLWLLFCSQY